MVFTETTAASRYPLRPSPMSVLPLPRKKHRSFEYAYGPDPLQTLDFYQCTSPSDWLLIFIVGAATAKAPQELVNAH